MGSLGFTCHALTCDSDLYTNRDLRSTVSSYKEPKLSKLGSEEHPQGLDTGPLTPLISPRKMKRLCHFVTHITQQRLQQKAAYSRGALGYSSMHLENRGHYSTHQEATPSLSGPAACTFAAIQLLMLPSPFPWRPSTMLALHR